MIVKDVYQSGINILIDGFKALMEERKTGEVPNYGAKSNTMFDHCQITFLVSDVRGVELITLKNLANTVEVLTENPFNSPKKLRPTMFSNEYPSVSSTEEYQRFAAVTSEVVQKNLSLIENLPEDFRKIPAMYRYNFAGSVSFDVLVTFSGSNLIQLIGVFPAQSLKSQDGTDWVDPTSQYFINKAVASFKKIYYDALEGIFGTVDMQTDVALEKLYFSKLRNRDMSTLDPDHNKIPNVLYAQAIHPMGSVDLASSAKPAGKEGMQIVKSEVIRRMDYADSVANGANNRTSFPHKSTFLLENTTFVMYAQCSIQTLLMLQAYTNIVTYYTDMKNVLGVSTAPLSAISEVPGGVKIDGVMYELPEDQVRGLIATENQIIGDLVNTIEKEKSDILNALRKYQKERDFYEENRYKNTKMRPPKSMIQRKEYYNMVPLYTQTCCVLKFTSKDLSDINVSKIPNNVEFRAIVKAMWTFYNTISNYLADIDG